VFVGPGVIFTNDLYPRSPRMEFARGRYRNNEWLKEILIGTGAAIGGGAVILAGRTIHSFATVGAGAVVTRDVPAHALMAGNPARQIGWVCRCGVKLNLSNGSAVCGCGLRFSLCDDGLTCASGFVYALNDSAK